MLIVDDCRCMLRVRSLMMLFFTHRSCCSCFVSSSLSRECSCKDFKPSKSQLHAESMMLTMLWSFNGDDDSATTLRCDLIAVNCGVIVFEGGDVEGVDGDCGRRCFLREEWLPCRCFVDVVSCFFQCDVNVVRVPYSALIQ